MGELGRGTVGAGGGMFSWSESLSSLGGLVRVWEADAGDVGGSVFADSEEPCDTLLDSGVLLRHVY